jgi:hypothetical protein
MMLSSSSSIQVIRKDVQQALIDNILEKASGVFLWVKLVVEEIIIGLEDGDTDQELQERLDSLPPELEDLYQRIIVQISPKHWRDTFNYFQLLIHARQPSLDLITFAYACEDASDALIRVYQGDEHLKLQIKEYCDRVRLRIKSRCRGLLQIEEPKTTLSSGFSWNQGSVRFLHRTVKEYVTAEALDASMRSWATSDQIINPHVSLMAACLRLIKSDARYLPTVPHVGPITSYVIKRHPGRLNILDFFYYARASEESTNTPQTIYIEELDDYCSHLDWYDSALELIPAPKKSVQWKTNMLSLAVQFGLRLYISEQLQAKNIEVNQISGRPLLHCALDITTEEGISSPKLAMVAVLLEYGALPNTIFEEVTPWGLAISRPEKIEGWIAVCELMLQHGADVHHQLDTLYFSTDTPLRIALDFISFRKANVALRKRLANLIASFLRLGADLHYKNRDGKTALDVVKRSYPEIRAVVLKHVEEQKSHRRGRSITPTGQRSAAGTRALPRRKCSHIKD